LLGQSRLVELELLAPATDDGAEISGCANEHRLGGN
jgi:hypothetical protein